MTTALREIGKPFPFREMQAVLTVCSSTGTMSTPLFINVRQYLGGAKHPAPQGDFSEKLFHELMHHYVIAAVKNSALRHKYENEPPIVLNHLHVMALEKLVLTRLGKTDELKFVEEEYRTDTDPAFYKRAWEIVNDVEGYEAFIKELKR